MSFFPLLLKTAEYLTPFSTLTYLSAKIADKRLGGFTDFLIKSFIKNFNINMDEVKNRDLSSYKTFNEFFIRELKAGARPIDKDCKAVFPVDGTIAQSGTVNAGRLIQAKGLDYSLKALIGGDENDCALFENGRFVTTYLSPSNYHRIHMPLNGVLRKAIHVPGKLFPVGSSNISYMPDLYAVNERMVCIFDTKEGPFAVIMVGAALVGSIHTSWGGDAIRRRGVETKIFSGNEKIYVKGDEIGYFKYGSTVICLWSDGAGEIAADLKEQLPVKMGRAMMI